MRKNPDSALSSILSEEERTALDSLSGIDNCIEISTTYEGTLEVVHADFFEDGVSNTTYTLSRSDSHKIELHPAGNIHVGLESGQKIRVKGVLIDNEMIFDATNSISQGQDFRGGIDIIMQPGNPPVLGEQKTVFLLVNFRNTSQPNLTTGQVSDLLTNTLNPYYVENSFGKISVTGDVFGWYTLDIDQSCNYSTVRSQAISASDNDVYFPNYSRLVIIAPFGPSCGWSGIAIIGKTTISTGDGIVSMSWAGIMSSYGTSLLVIGHELGHNFGNHHASFLDCADVTIADSGCVVYEYGDGYNIMGNARPFHFNGPHKEYVGWFEPNNIQTVTSSGTYILEPIETQTANLKVLKIQRYAWDYMYIEYRQPIGYDTLNITVGDIYQGALLHSLLSPNKTALLDPTPLDNSTSTITLTVGSSFIDPATGTQITTSAKTSNSLTLNVSLGKTDFTAPTVKITSPLYDATVSGIVVVAADASDASGIQKVEFYLDGTGIANLLGADLDAPYGFSWNTLQVANGTHYLYVKAYDKSGEPWGVSGNSALDGVMVTVANAVTPTLTLTPTPPPPPPTQTPAPTLTPTPAPDTIPPSVSITSPTNGNTVSTKTTVTITASASDNVGGTGVAKVEFYVNGVLLCTDTTAAYACLWSVPAKPKVTYTLQAKAYDKSGNTSSKSIQVTSSIK